MSVIEGEFATQSGTPSPDRHRTRRRLRRALIGVGIVDAAVLAFGMLLAWNARLVVDLGDFSTSASSANLRATPAIVTLWMLVLTVADAYSVRNLAEGAEEYRILAYASFLTASLTFAFCFLMHAPLSRLFLILAFGIATPLLFLGRFMVRQTIYSLRRTGHMLHRVVAVGGPSGVSEVVDTLSRNVSVGYQVVGACIPDDLEIEPDRIPVPTLGRVEQLRTICHNVGADSVLVTRGGFATARELRRVAWELEGSDIDLIVVPSVTDVAGPRIQMRPVAGLPLVHVEEPQAGKAMGVSKRAFDLVFAAAALVALSPLFIIVAVMVKLQDGGPVFFRQARVGASGEIFKMIKFRSMVVDAEARLAELVAMNEKDAVLFKMREDPRMTRVGKYLRRYSIDELPQLINVLRGEMSVVGPRPPLPSEVEQYTFDVRRRLVVRPGLTGLWQVSGRSALSWDESVRLDLYYVDNWSMMGDIVILVKTIKAVFGSAGAY